MAIVLIGIVFMQVSLLKLNAGISRAVTAADTFERQNASLREDISKLDSGERIQGVAAKLGMVMPAAGDVRYLDGRGADAARAAAAIKPPDPVDPDGARPRPTTASRPRRRPRPATDAAPARRRPPAPAATAGRDGARGDDRRARHDQRRARDRHDRAAPTTTGTSDDRATCDAAPPAVAGGGASAPQGQG